MAYTLSNKCATDSKRIVPLQLIIKNVVTFFLEHCFIGQVNNCYDLGEI